MLVWIERDDVWECEKCHQKRFIGHLKNKYRTSGGLYVKCKSRHRRGLFEVFKGTPMDLLKSGDYSRTGVKAGARCCFAKNLLLVLWQLMSDAYLKEIPLTTDVGGMLKNPFKQTHAEKKKC